MVQVAIPDADTSTTGNWIDDNMSSGNLYDQINDGTSEDDNDGSNTFIQCEDQGSDDSCVVSLSDLSKPGAGNVTFTVGASAYVGMEGNTVPNLRVDLCEGAGHTVRATHTFSGIAASSGDTFPNYTSSALDVSSVSDDKWDELFVKITLVSNGNYDSIYITQVFLTTPDAGAAGATATSTAFLLFLD